MDAIHYKNYRQVEKRYNELADGDMKWYFDSFFELVQKPTNPKITWDMTIAYLFMKVEQAHRMTLYALIVRKHKVARYIAAEIIDECFLSRDEFPKLYKELAGENFCKDITKYYDNAVNVRNAIMHGKGIFYDKTISDQVKRDAVVSILEYANLFNKQTEEIVISKQPNVKFDCKPFGRMQGFSGGTRTLDILESIKTSADLKIPLKNRMKKIHEMIKAGWEKQKNVK